MANNVPSLNVPYLLLTGVIVVAIVFLFVVLQPMMQEINSIRKTIGEDTQILTDKEHFLTSLDTKIQQLNSLGNVESQIAAVLPETDRTQDVVRVLSEYATQSGITIVAVTNNSSASDSQTNAARARGEVINIPSGVRTLSFELRLNGAYEQIRSFMTLLSRSPRIMDVTGLSFKQVSLQPGQVDAAVTVQLYAQQPPAAS